MEIKDILDKKEKSSIQLSVIVPIYNAQDTICLILEDIQKQCYHNFEVIMVDDGSRDESGLICKKFAASDERFIYIHQDNHGVSSARNRGLSIAKGKYISFLDADDRIFPDRFEQLIGAINKENNIDLIIGKYCIEIKEGTVPFSLWQSDLVGKHDLETLLYDYTKAMDSFYYGVIWNKLYRRNIIIDYDIKFDESICWGEDLLFNLQYYKYINNCIYLNENVYCYCYTEKSLISDISIYKAHIDFVRYRKIMELGRKIQKPDNRKIYVRAANKLLLNRVIRQMSMKVINSSFFDFTVYNNFKSYLLSPEVNLFWTQNKFSRENIVYKILQKLIIKKQYRLLYYFFVLKDKINKNKIWEWMKKKLLKLN